jgi:DNA-binding Lrp family transcriptional regulator
MMTRPLDEIDHQLLQALQQDARLSNKELAARVGVAPSTCHVRLRRLVDDGVILGFHAEVDPAVLGVGLEAIVAVRMAIQTVQAFNDLQEALTEMPEVVALYNVAGAVDFFVHVAVRDTDHLRNTVVDGLTSRPDVGGVETSLIFEHRRSRTLPSYRG